MAKYNSGNVPADFLEKRWGNTDFGDINAVVVNKEGFGNGWAEAMPEEFHMPINSREDLQKAIYGNALGDLDTHHYAELNSNIRPQDVASVRSLPKGGMPKDNTFLDDIAQRLYATKGNPKATRDLINKYMLAFGGAIPAGGVLAGLMGSNDDQSMV